MSLRLALSLLVALAAGCHRLPAAGRESPDTAAASVMDAPLRQHLATISDDAPVDVLVGIGATMPDEARRGLEAVGLEVRTVTGGVAVARGVRAAVERAAALPWVEQMDLSQERSPSTPRP